MDVLHESESGLKPAVVQPDDCRGVYSAESGHVKNAATRFAPCRLIRYARAAGPLLLGLWWAVAFAGCHTASPHRNPVNAYPLAIRYAVEPLYGPGGDAPQDVMERDFTRLRGLGFNTILASHVDDAQCEALVDIAASHGLRVILPPRDLLYYVRTGEPAGWPDTWNRAEDSVWCRDGVGLYLGSVGDAASASRAGTIAVVCRRQAPHQSLYALRRSQHVPADGWPPGVVPIIPVSPRPNDADMQASSNPPDVPPGLAAIPVTARGTTTEDGVRSWLGLYHAGLCAGGTEGVVLDAYAEVPGRQRGLVDRNTGLSLERSAVVKRILSRARKWGPLLRGSRPATVQGVECPSADVRVTLFVHGPRRLLLVRNRSTTRFARTTVHVPRQLGDAAAERAVEVAAEPGVLGGAVFRKRRGKIALDVDLAPGNASLFEVF